MILYYQFFCCVEYTEDLDIMVLTFDSKISSESFDPSIEVC